MVYSTLCTQYGKPATSSIRFELDNSGESTPKYVVLGFLGRNKIDSPTHNNSTFNRLSVSNAVCKTGADNYPDDGIDCDNSRDKYD